ncbi:RBBP9/YdeN family alpha/beta hydrolase [Paludibacterium denitrificans]|uniref:RBBP9/YdeN family alpha/beta hydrolase n=1 Tax=Paludibacterium denitrificans TaxID=2675226 RepID=UPI0035E3F82F
MAQIDFGVDFIIQPGWKNSGPQHWQSHWQQLLGAIRVEHDNWEQPQLDTGWRRWTGHWIRPAARPLSSPIALGCITVAHHAARHPGRIAGALLVAPADVERAFAPRELMSFAPVPRPALPFPTRLIASTNDPFCKASRSARLAFYWQSPLNWLQQATSMSIPATASGKTGYPTCTP